VRRAGEAGPQILRVLPDAALRNRGVPFRAHARGRAPGEGDGGLSVRLVALAGAALLGGWLPGRALARYPAPPAWWERQAACIRHAESLDGRLSRNLYQFLDSTWRSVHGLARAETASRAEQDYRAWLVYRRDGGSWREWTTARGCGLT